METGLVELGAFMPGHLAKKTHLRRTMPDKSANLLIPSINTSAIQNSILRFQNIRIHQNLSQYPWWSEMQRHRRPFWNIIPISHMLSEKAVWCDITCCLRSWLKHPACHAVPSLHRCKGYGPADWRPVLPVRSLQRWKSAPAIRVHIVFPLGGGPFHQNFPSPQRCR